MVIRPTEARNLLIVAFGKYFEQNNFYSSFQNIIKNEQILKNTLSEAKPISAKSEVNLALY